MVEVQRRRAFIGREAEMARLGALLDLVVTGTGRTVIVGGEAGIGKSRLVWEFGRLAAARARVVEGACLEVADEGLPYGPFAEILRALVRATPEGRLVALLGPGRAELTRLLPELALRAADTRVTEAGQAGGADRLSQARLFELFLGLFERLAAEQPLVVVIEDVQWADRSTRDLLGFLVRALRDEPVLLLLTTRTNAEAAALGDLAFLAELEREEQVERIELRPFDRDEVAEHAAALLDEPLGQAELDRLMARSDGNPFYVEELVLARALDRGLPPVLRDVLAARVANLSGPAREVLRAAAAAGRRIDDELLAAVFGGTRRELAAALREALASGILVRLETHEGPVSAFRHGLLLEAVADELFPGERMALHAAFAVALESRVAGGDRSVPAAEIARHWDGAREPARALPFTIRAAIAAESAYAFAEARSFWERAAAMLEATPELASLVDYDVTEVLMRAADAANVTGDPGRAVELAGRALVATTGSADRERTLTIENRLRWYLWWSGQRAAAADAVRVALEEIPAAPPSLARLRALAQQAGILMSAGDHEQSQAFAREAIAMGEALEHPEETALAYGVLGWDIALLGDVDGGIEIFGRGRAIGEATGSIEGIAIAVTNLPGLLDRVGRSEDALRAAHDGYRVVEHLGIARTYGGMLLGFAAKSELALGRWNDADRTTALALRRGAVDRPAVWLLVNRARLLTGRGRFEDARVLLRRAHATDDRLGGTELRTALLAAEAELAVWEGRTGDVMALGAEGLVALERAGGPDPALAWLAALVLRAVADARGTVDAATAAELVGRIRSAVRTAESRPGFVAGERAVALVALLRAEEGRTAARSAPEAWADVAGRWSAMGRPYPEAYARFREAEARLASRGSRAAAAEALRVAAAIAGRLGAAPLGALVATLARQARISLAEAEATAEPHDRDPYGITAREGEVLRLVAGGWTNQQIADALFITRKTASVHVSNILGKLGVESRGEAAALAHRLGLVDEVPLPGARR